MANVNVTYQELQQAATTLTNGQSEIEQQLGTLSSMISSLVSDGFVTDQASGQFEASYTEFTNGAKQTIEGLTGMAKYLNTAASTFQDVDSQLASALNK